jgi:hypothetical protein
LFIGSAKHIISPTTHSSMVKTPGASLPQMPREPLIQAICVPVQVDFSSRAVKIWLKAFASARFFAKVESSTLGRVDGGREVIIVGTAVFTSPVGVIVTGGFVVEGFSEGSTGDPISDDEDALSPTEEDFAFVLVSTGGGDSIGLEVEVVPGMELETAVDTSVGKIGFGPALLPSDLFVEVTINLDDVRSGPSGRGAVIFVAPALPLVSFVTSELVFALVDVVTEGDTVVDSKRLEIFSLDVPISSVSPAPGLAVFVVGIGDVDVGTSSVIGITSTPVGTNSEDTDSSGGARDSDAPLGPALPGSNVTKIGVGVGSGFSCGSMMRPRRVVCASPLFSSAPLFRGRPFSRWLIVLG